MQAESQETIPACLGKRSKTARSAISNGTRWVQGDQRSPWARRFRDLVALHAEDAGGLESLSQAQLALIRRAATIEVELERKESILANGGEINLDEFNRASGGLRRLLETIGLERKPRNITPSLKTIVESHRANTDSKDGGDQ